MVKQRNLMIAILPLMLLIAGCYNVDITHTISPDGSSSVEIILDYKPYMEILRESEENEFEEPDIEGVCDSLDFEYYGLENAACSVISQYEILITGEYPAGSLELREEEGIIIYDIKSMYSLLGFIAMPSSARMEFTLGDEESADVDSEIPVLDDEYLEDMSEARDMIDLQHNYEVIMPGEVISADIGIITGNSVMIDMFDLPGIESPVIEAATEDPFEEQDIFEEEGLQIGDGEEEQLPAEPPFEPQQEEVIQATTTTSFATTLQYILIGLLGLTVIGFLFTLLTRRGKQEPKQQEKALGAKPPRTAQIATPPVDMQRVNQIISWLHQYEQKFPPQILKDVLIKKGYTQQEVEEAFKRKNNLL